MAVVSSKQKRASQARTRKPRRGQPRRAYKGDAKPAIIAEIEAGTPRSKAGPAAGVSRETFYTWLDEDPQFALEVEAAEARRIRKLVGRAERLINRGDASLVRTLLRPLAEEFRKDTATAEPVSVSVHNSVSVAITAEDLAAIQKQREAALLHGRH